MKKILKILKSFLPLIIILCVMIYLGLINRVSEVYLDLQSTTMNFVLAENIDNFISMCPIDSVKIFNCNVKFKYENIGFNVKKNTFMPKQLNVLKRNEHLSSEIILSNTTEMVLEKLRIPIFSKISIMKENIGFRIEITLPSSNSKDFKGEININDNFLFQGKNVTIESLNNYSDYLTLNVTPHRLFKNIIFESNANSVILLIYSKLENKDDFTILQNLFVNNIGFSKINLSRRKNMEESSIISGNIHIAAIDFFKKRFLFKEKSIVNNDFLECAYNDEYFINFIELKDNSLDISVSCEKASELKMGRRVGLLRSILPSVLEFLMVEPTKKTFWTILIFILTQLSLIKNHLKKFIVGRKVENNEVK